MQILKALESDYQTYGLSVINENNLLYELLNKNVSVCMNDSSIIHGKLMFINDDIIELEMINNEELYLNKNDINYIAENSIFESFKKMNV